MSSKSFSGELDCAACFEYVGKSDTNPGSVCVWGGGLWMKRLRSGLYWVCNFGYETGVETIA